MLHPRFTTVAAAALLAACGSSPSAGGLDGGRDGHDGRDDASNVDIVDSTEVADTSETVDDASNDTNETDSADASIDDGAPDGGLANGLPCDEDSDCIGLLCIAIVDVGGAGVCSSRCVDDADCPENAECVTLVGSGVDQTRVCLDAELCLDADRDGYGVGPGCLGPDCAPDDALVSPAADEICNGFDDDCDTRVDENPVGVGFSCDTGAPGLCAEGRVECADGIATCTQRLAAQPEVCNSLDDDCDGETDDGAIDANVYFADTDGDRFGDTLVEIRACALPDEASVVAGDCDDARADVSPDAIELCDAIDNNCDEIVDVDAADRLTFYRDADGDGFGSPADFVIACTAPDGFVANSSDCDDANTFRSPAAIEIVGNQVDENCDGTELCFADLDNDGFRSQAVATSVDVLCDAPGEASAAQPADDCNDENASIFPGAPEPPGDGIDGDCNGREICHADLDNDGVRTDARVDSPDLSCDAWGEAWAFELAGDCNDADAAVSPLASEICNAVDDDCDSAIDDLGGACTVAIIRSYDDYHFYTTSLSEAGCCGFTIEQNPAFHLYAAQVAGTVPFYRCADDDLGRHHYTTDVGCEGYSRNEGVLGYIATSAMPGSTALYRMYKADDEDHLFTVDPVEVGYARGLGYVDEGVVGHVFTSPR